MLCKRSGQTVAPEPHEVPLHREWGCRINHKTSTAYLNICAIPSMSATLRLLKTILCGFIFIKFGQFEILTAVLHKPYIYKSNFYVGSPMYSDAGISHLFVSRCDACHHISFSCAIFIHASLQRRNVATAAKPLTLFTDACSSHWRQRIAHVAGNQNRA